MAEIEYEIIENTPPITNAGPKKLFVKLALNSSTNPCIFIGKDPSHMHEMASLTREGKLCLLYCPDDLGLNTTASGLIVTY